MTSYSGGSPAFAIYRTATADAFCANGPCLGDASHVAVYDRFLHRGFLSLIDQLVPLVMILISRSDLELKSVLDLCKSGEIYIANVSCYLSLSEQLYADPLCKAERSPRVFSVHFKQTQKSSGFNNYIPRLLIYSHRSSTCRFLESDLILQVVTPHY